MKESELWDAIARDLETESGPAYGEPLYTEDPLGLCHSLSRYYEQDRVAKNVRAAANTRLADIFREDSGDHMYYWGDNDVADNRYARIAAATLLACLARGDEENPDA